MLTKPCVWFTISFILLAYFLVFKKIKEEYSSILAPRAEQAILSKEQKLCKPMEKVLSNAFGVTDVVGVVKNMRLVGSSSEDPHVCYLKQNDTILNKQTCNKDNPNLFNNTFANVVTDIYPGMEKDPYQSSSLETPVCYVKFQKDAEPLDMVEYAAFVNNNDPEYQKVLSDFKNKINSMYTKDEFDKNYVAGYSSGKDEGQRGMYSQQQVQNVRNEALQQGSIQALSAVDTALKQTTQNVGWQGGGRSRGGEVWGKVCGSPWNAYYKFGCEINGRQSGWSDEVGPVSHHNYQAPKVRVAPNGPNYCSQQGGKLKVARVRPTSWSNRGWEDISNKVRDFNTTGPYDGKDAIFFDNYKTDC